ncbi:MAG: DNRLRE domain-containing protein, partial [bacterium]|nr:DNRLRE domain-containing protein [bacterium]
MYHAEDVANRVHNRPQARAAAGGRRPGRWLLILLAFALIFGASERAPAATTYTLRPVADTVAKQAFPNNNYGTVATLPIRYGATGRAEYVFLRFSVPALAGSVTSATLSARVTGTVREVSSYATSMGNPTWAENWLTWNNWSAGTSFTFLGSRANLNPGTNHTVDVTGWLTPPNTTFGLVSAIDAAGQSFSSREGSVAPTLTIVTSGN